MSEQGEEAQMCGVCFFWEDGGGEQATVGSSSVLGLASVGGAVGSQPSRDLCGSNVAQGGLELCLASWPPGRGLGANLTGAPLPYTLLPSAGK